MARKKLIAAAIGMLLPMAAEALTLGQVKVGSLLDQPLKAAIEVTADQPSELESLRVGLASAGEFSSKGIPRLPMLDDLRFEVVRKSATTALIVVTSRSAVREPFVDFLMDGEGWVLSVEGEGGTEESVHLLGSMVAVEEDGVEVLREGEGRSALRIRFPDGEPRVIRTVRLTPSLPNR